MNHILQSHAMRYSVLALAVASTFSIPAFAEDEPQHETIQVLGKAYRNTATKTSLEPLETPQGLTIIEGEQLELRAVKSLNQALRYAPGVITENKGGSVTMYDTFTIRGFSSPNSYYDGLALPSLPGWNLQPQIDPIAMERIEIFKGPTSVLYGAMPPGGMVNMIAKAPQLTQKTSVNVATGTGNLLEASIDTTGAIGDNMAYRIIALGRKKDGQVDYTTEERYVFAPSLDWYVSDQTFVNFNLYYQNDPSMGMNSALPSSGMITDNPNGKISRNTYAGDKNWSTFKREYLLAGYKVNHEFNNSWSFLQNFRYMDSKLYQENSYHTSANWDASTGNLTRNFYSTDEKSKSYSVDNQLSGLVSTDNADHYLLFGLDYQDLTGSSNYQEYSGGAGVHTINLFNPNNNLVNRDKMNSVYDSTTDISAKQLGLYAQDQITFDKLIVVAGGRFDDYKSKSGTTTEANHHAFSYRVGGIYQLDTGFSPFANYATSFEPKAGLDKDGNAFKPEIGAQIEAGVKYQSYDDTKTATVSAYHITKSDMVVSDGSGNFQNMVQIGEVRSQGIELDGNLALNESLNISASYTYTDMEITKDGDSSMIGKTPIYVPEHTATLWSNYSFNTGSFDGARIGGGVRYVGEMQMDAANTAKVPGYTLVDLSVGYDLGKVNSSLNGASANLIANNLFNTEYYTCYDSANCWYGQEQTIELNVKFDL